MSQMPSHQSDTLLTPEEEALKSNTDCVYFLASPLTCKKGAECEYRHSEIARLNPRDCWYWSNGSCLNPKCAFRHPPLEGMLGPQVPAPSGATLPPNQTTATPVSSAPHNNNNNSNNSGKQAVPCIFFQQGFCLKGDRCPFSHGPAFANNTKPPQAPVSAPAFTKPPSTFKKPYLGIEKCSTDPSVVKETYVPPKPTIAPHQVKQSPTNDESTIERHARHSSSGANDYNAPIYRPPPAANGNLIIRANREVHTPDDYDTTFNSKEPGEFSREPSPGFDVLVDDELREGDYYPEEGEYERTRSNEDRRLTPVNDYDIRRPIDYKDLDSMVDADRDTFRRYDSFDPTRGQYGRDQRRVSPERRRYPSPDRVDGSDLRSRLSKHRKVNGLRSVISHDMDRDGRDHSYRGNSRRSTTHMPAGERVGSDRFRGRIKLPGRSTSPPNGRERGNSRGRLSSPGRFQGGRVQDRIRGKVHEDTDAVARDFRGSRTGEMMYDQVNFAGPKSLSELRVNKGTEYNNNNKQPVNDYQRSVVERKRKYSENSQQVENFEGPKPLSEILKRKRGGGGDVHDEDSKQASKGVGEEDSKAVEVRNINAVEDLQVEEEGVIVEDEVDYDQEHEVAYADEGEGEYEYEPVEGDDYKEEEAENVEEGGEYAEDDDGDDFAKKIGVMFS